MAESPAPPTPLRGALADRQIGDLAARQHATLSRQQLLRAGLSASSIDERVANGRLRILHRGVYLTGPLPTPHTHLMAALLACGPHSALCCRTATITWGLPSPASDPKAVEIAVTRGHPHRRTGIRVYRLKSLRADEITTRLGLRITTPARTLMDLARTAGPRELENAVATGIAERLVTMQKLIDTVQRHANLPCARRLHGILDQPGPPSLTRSEAEERLLALIRRARIDSPLTNTSVKGLEVDFFWPDQRLVVEVDGQAFHSSRRAFERDRRRDARLIAAGLVVMRVTWQQIADEPETVLAQLVRALTRREGKAVG